MVYSKPEMLRTLLNPRAGGSEGFVFNLEYSQDCLLSGAPRIEAQVALVETEGNLDYYKCSNNTESQDLMSILDSRRQSIKEENTFLGNGPGLGPHCK